MACRALTPNPSPTEWERGTEPLVCGALGHVSTRFSDDESPLAREAGEGKGVRDIAAPFRLSLPKPTPRGIA